MKAIITIIIIGIQHFLKTETIFFSEESTTFNTLKGLKKRGVKVELGFPDEMWDTPDAEVTRLKSRVNVGDVIC